MNTPLPSKLRTFHSLLRALACMAFIIVLSPVQAPGAVQGTVVAWGGYGDSGETNVPSDLRSVVAIAAGYYHTVALKQNGKVVVWGSNSDGQTNVPAGLSNVVAIAARGGFTMALKQDGTVVSWGDNYSGQTNVPVGLLRRA